MIFQPSVIDTLAWYKNSQISNKFYNIGPFLCIIFCNKLEWLPLAGFYSLVQQTLALYKNKFRTKKLNNIGP
jgi:hypothetical protein